MNIKIKRLADRLIDNPSSTQPTLEELREDISGLLSQISTLSPSVSEIVSVFPVELN